MPRWNEAANEIFLQALEHDSLDTRCAYLDNACGTESEMRAEVESLLEAGEHIDGFLESPPSAVAATIDQPSDEQPAVEQPGTMIGSYKLIEEIGEGGMGSVFMALQMEPVRRNVALKVIRLGMDSQQVVSRFEAERQALAMMDHPNIAKVLDAGATQTGRPYFVMELVRGMPITEYCDANNLTAKERLGLFIEICHAVQHAHQRGIIHRDIKPSNVMVTLYDGVPAPKIIDFGIARATDQQLTERTTVTDYGQMVGTPLYMSPEQTQMSGLDIDTRSDVYSLGVLLYELLTGTTPFEKEALKNAEFDEIRRMIREDEPPRPSARISTLDAELLSTVSARRTIDPRKLGPLCGGELDWIVMKALEKDRTRRYETANDFAADIQRYLNDELIQACPPSAVYRFRKFARQNKVALATAALVAAALLMGLIGTTWQAFRAKEAEGAAKTERDTANTERNHAVEAKQRAIKAEEAAHASRRKAEDHSHQVTRLLASSYADLGQALCEDGEIGRGMLWLAHSLETTPDDATDIERVIRTNLAAWRPQLHSLKTLVQHDREVRGVAFSPDGSRILTISGGRAVSGWRAVQLWDTATGQPIGDPIRHKGCNAIAFSPDGSRIVTGSNDGTAQLWDAAGLKPIGQPLAHRTTSGFGIMAVAFSRDGSRFVTGSKGGTVGLWDAATGQPVREPFEHEEIDSDHPWHRVRAVAITPGGSRAVVTISSGTHQLWDTDRGEPIGPPVNSSDTAAVAISPDGARFATAGFRSVIELWDAATGKSVPPPMTHGGLIAALAFSPDGSRLVSGGADWAARLWDVNTGQVIGVPMRHRGMVQVVAFSPDGTQILTGSHDGTARLWDVARDISLGHPLQHEDPVLAAAFSPDGLCILTKSDGAVQLSDADTGRPIGKPFPMERAGGRTKMPFSPDGSRVLVGDNLWDVATGQLIGQCGGGDLFDAAFSPDGSRLVTGYQKGSGGFGRVWDARTAQPIGKPLPHDGVVSRVAFSFDGSRILTGSYDATTRLWDAVTLNPIGRPMIHQSHLESLAYSPDGAQIFTGFADWTARLWDVQTRKAVGMPLQHQNIVSGVAFSPDGARLLTGSLDQTARLWDTATLKPIGPPLRHESFWPRVSFNRDGSRFLVVGRHATARFWESPPGALEGDRERILLWAQVVTGLELSPGGGIGVLDGPAWQKLHRRLQELGGPPTAASLPGPVSKTETDFPPREMNQAPLGLAKKTAGE